MHYQKSLKLKMFFAVKFVAQLTIKAETFKKCLKRLLESLDHYDFDSSGNEN